MGSTLMTPLYALYRREFGFSEITLTLVYSIYVVGNVTALLLFGGVSDRIGRKRVGLPALALAGLSAVLFLFASNTAWLFVARTLSGFAVGIASGTGTAWLAELYGSKKRSLATVAAACANFAGVAVGPLLSGPLAQYAPRPLQLSFIVYLALAALVAFLLARAPETVEQECTIRQALTVRPRLGVPRALWGQFIAPAVNVFGTFALVGFYAALIPTILMQELNQKNLAVGGAVVFELFAVSAVTILVTRAIKSDRAMFSGLALLPPGFGLLVSAQELKSMPLLLVATLVGGIAAGLGYRGSLQVINDIAPDDKRAEVVSSYYVAGFVGNSLPIIGVGLLTAISGAATAGITFAAIIAAFSVAAIVVGTKYRAVL